MDTNSESDDRISHELAGSEAVRRTASERIPTIGDEMVRIQGLTMTSF